MKRRIKKKREKGKDVTTNTKERRKERNKKEIREGL